MNDQIKTVSLAIIAIALVVQTIIQLVSGNTNSVVTSSENTALNEQNPINPLETRDASAKSETQTQSEAPKTTMVFEEYEHNFGTIKEGQMVTHVFNFVNTGTNPLIIANAKGSCGCTVPEWPKDPIPPGERGKITVSYDSKNRSGSQEKTVSITANTDPQITQLKIKAQVIQEAKLDENPAATTKK